MPVKLDDDKIKYVIREKEKGTLNATIAESMRISSRHVRRLWAKYRSTGSLPTISSGGRPATKTISDEEVEMVLAECRRGCSGVGRVTKALADKNISGRTVYNIIEIMRNPSKPHADKFRSDTITPHVKCQIHLIRPYASCNRRSKN